MLRSYFNFAVIFISTLLLSCASPEEKKQSSEGDRVYDDFRNFVVAIEEDAESEEKVEINDTTIIQEEVNALKMQYTTFKDKIDENTDYYSSHQREVLMDLRDRFTIALDKKQKKYEDAARRYRLRQEVLGADVRSDDLSEITADNIKTTYRNFVNSVTANQATYTDRDWENIEGFWSALNSRKEQLEEELKPADTVAIAKQQERYQNLRTKESS